MSNNKFDLMNEKACSYTVTEKKMVLSL